MTTLVLVIAEKPSLARAIRAAVGAEYTITHAFGHLLEQASPDTYLPDDLPRTSRGAKVWRWQDLPIIPAPRGWKKQPRPGPGAKKQIAEIQRLLAGATCVVNAGDPDREGQLLIDEIIAALGYHGPVSRLWLTSLTSTAIRTAFAKMRPNTDYAPLSAAAEARARADWLVGMNLTRAWTLSTGSLLSVGRVQTPTLALIVTRDLEIEQFRVHDFFEAHARMSIAGGEGGEFAAKWTSVDTDGTGFDPEGRLIDRSIADRIIARAQATGRGTVIEYRAERKSRPAPLPYSLSALQKTASARLNLGAQQVLDAAQGLYESKFTTYPRTDCRHIPDDQFVDVRAAAKALAPQYHVTFSDTTTAHVAFNSKKVTAHTALVPTTERAGGLSGAPAAVYDLIVRSTLALFMPALEYEQVMVTVSIGDEKWTATGKRVTNPGWTVLYGGTATGDEVPLIPAMRAGDPIECVSAQVVAKKTTPPARLTDGTLIDAMSHIHRYVTDPAARARLKETSGLGTEATRARIIETLFARGWIERTGGKAVVSTDAGRAVIAALPADLTDPATTAQWEDALAEIAAGRGDAVQFEQRIADFVRSSIAHLTPPAPRADAPTAECPVCGQLALARRLESKKKPGVFFWACENRDHGLLTDDGGKPGKPFSFKSNPKSTRSTCMKSRRAGPVKRKSSGRSK